MSTEHEAGGANPLGRVAAGLLCRQRLHNWHNRSRTRLYLVGGCVFGRKLRGIVSVEPDGTSSSLLLRLELALDIAAARGGDTAETA